MSPHRCTAGLLDVAEVVVSNRASTLRRRPGGDADGQGRQSRMPSHVTGARSSGGAAGAVMSKALRDPRLQLVGAQACLASLMVIGREALLTIPPDVIAWARLLGGGIVFALIARACGDRDKLQRKDVARLIACGALGTASNQLFLVHGLAGTTAVNASIL